MHVELERSHLEYNFLVADGAIGGFSAGGGWSINAFLVHVLTRLAFAVDKQMNTESSCVCWYLLLRIVGSLVIVLLLGILGHNVVLMCNITYCCLQRKKLLYHALVSAHLHFLIV